MPVVAGTVASRKPGQGSCKGKGLFPSPEESQGEDEGKGKQGKGIAMTNRSNTCTYGTSGCRGIIAEGESRLAGSAKQITDQLVARRKEKRKADCAHIINVVKQTLLNQRDACYEDAFQT